MESEAEIIRSLQTKYPLYPTAKVILERHDCIIEEDQAGHTNISFPKGSLRTLRPPHRFSLHNESYDITLPDGCYLLDVYNGPLDTHNLYVAPETEEERAALQQEAEENG